MFLECGFLISKIFIRDKEIKLLLSIELRVRSYVHFAKKLLENIVHPRKPRAMGEQAPPSSGGGKRGGIQASVTTTLRALPRELRRCQGSVSTRKWDKQVDESDRVEQFYKLWRR